MLPLLPRSWCRTGLVIIWVVAALVAAIPAGAQPPYRVAILVVDDFSGVDLAEFDPAQFDAASNCAVSLESQAFVVGGVSADPIEVPHGDLVYAELEAMIEDAGAGDFIELVQVDVQGMATGEVADLISTAISETSADAYVINMSFAVIPCEFIGAMADFESQMTDARRGKDYNKHRGLFQRAVLFYDGTVYPVMSQHAQSETDLDPLQTLLVSLSANTVPVASAGNFGLDFPFWPGSWGQVISVSASTGEGFYAPAAWDDRRDTPLLSGEVQGPGQTKRISNYGEVMMPGEYASDSGPVTGTSFAAPRLSVAVALYLAQVGGNFCRTSDGTPALAYGEWDNLTLDQAVQNYCPDMEPFLP